MSSLPDDLKGQLRKAIKHFWSARGGSAVRAGKHLDGFLKLIAKILERAGLKRSHIYWHTQTELPGWYRAEKKWDLLVVADGKLIAIMECKSQVGSFGNNFNNRTEEALGSASDIWSAYEEGAFKPSERPWLGYLMLLEDNDEVKTPVAVREPHFKVFPEFESASYLKRYEQLLTRLVRKRLYDSCCLLTSSQLEGKKGAYIEPSPELNFEKFISSLSAKVGAVATLQAPGPVTPPKIESGIPEGETEKN